MTGIIFKNYFKKLNNQMKTEKRKILLFLDNAGSHPDIKLLNIQLQYLPPNTTSELQPLDAGVIANFKVNYRKLLLQNILIEIENCSNVSELAKNVTLLEAIRFLRLDILFKIYMDQQFVV